MRTETLRPHYNTKTTLVLTRADDTPQVKAFLLCFVYLDIILQTYSFVKHKF